MLISKVYLVLYSRSDTKSLCLVSDVGWANLNCCPNEWSGEVYIATLSSIVQTHFLRNGIKSNQVNGMWKGRPGAYCWDDPFLVFWFTFPLCSFLLILTPTLTRHDFHRQDRGPWHVHPAHRGTRGATGKAVSHWNGHNVQIANV
jgi:hypothetical protein